jgi:hypothetical protein
MSILGRPDAWRKEPFFSKVKELSALMLRIRAQVVVFVGRRATMVFPDREVDLGIIADDDLIVTGERATSFGVELDALKLKKDDPLVCVLASSEPLAMARR